MLKRFRDHQAKDILQGHINKYQLVILMKNILKIAISIILLSFVCNFQTSGQLNNHLILKKGPRNKIHFLTGDSIILMKNNFKTPYRERIQGIGEDFIVIRNEEVPIKEITGIVKVRALHYKAAGHIFKFAGPSLILVGIINGLFSGQRPLIIPQMAIIGGIISGIGFILPTFQTKVYHMKRAYYLRIVPSDLTIPSPPINE